MMKLLDRYLFFSIIKSTIISLFVLGLLFGFFKFLEELNDIGTKNYDFSAALSYLFFIFPSILNSLVVLSVLIAVVMTLGKLNSNRELQIFHTAAISRKYIIIHVIQFSFWTSLALIIIFELVSPQMWRFGNQIKNQALGNYLSENKDYFWIKNENNFINIKKIDNDYASLKIFELDENLNLKKISEDLEAKFEVEGIISKSRNAINIKQNKNFLSIQSSRSEDKYSLEFDNQLIEKMSKDARELSLYEISYLLIFSFNNKINSHELLNEFITRLIRPINLIGMILIAFPFLIDFQREVSVAQRVFIASAIGILAHLISKILFAVSIKFQFVGIFGAILPSLFLIILGSLIFKLYKNKEEL